VISEEVDLAFINEWRAKTGYDHLDLVNLDPAGRLAIPGLLHGRLVWAYSAKH
jgi:hypothetical protein